jgi:hypothetical protein
MTARTTSSPHIDYNPEGAIRFRNLDIVINLEDDMVRSMPT